MQRLSSHRPLFLSRNVLKSSLSPDDENTGFYTSSCRLGSSTLVVGQTCIRKSNRQVIQDKDSLIDFGKYTIISKATRNTNKLLYSKDLKLNLPRDTLGFVRRDTQEDKERQVQELIKKKIIQCIDLKQGWLAHVGGKYGNDDQLMQIDSK